MAKWTPSIWIWDLELRWIEDEDIVQHIYFLSRKRAERFWQKHKAIIEKDHNASLGGEQLWLW